MDRQIVWPGAVPVETDLLGTNRNMMVGLGRALQDLLGTSTQVAGLACTQTTVASMTVNIGAGAIYSLQNIDNTAYSSLAADTTDQIIKQGILLASANQQLTMTAPTTSGYSVIYLIEAAYSEIDGTPVTLPFYNSANPSSPFSGPANNGLPSFTVRAGKVNVQAKSGVAGTSPTAPSVDTGFVPLYYVTIAYGQTTITSANIAVATGAPFIGGGLGSLASYMPIAGGTFSGTVSGPTPATSDNSNKFATTAMVHAAINPGVLLSVDGWEKRASGLIDQWGTLTVTSGANVTITNVTFPIAFPNACFGVVGNQTLSADGPTWHPLVLGFLSQTTSGFSLQADTANSSINIASGVSVNWRAHGY